MLCALLALAAAFPAEQPAPELTQAPGQVSVPVAAVETDGDLDTESTLFHKSVSLGVSPYR